MFDLPMNKMQHKVGFERHNFFLERELTPRLTVLTVVVTSSIRSTIPTKPYRQSLKKE